MHLATIVTLEDLARAMVRKLGLAPEAATEQAEYVLDLFGFEEEILDNVLDPEDRQLFYAMEARGLVSTRSEENQLHHGQDWRTHVWTLRSERVHAAAGPAGVASFPAAAATVSDDVYAALPVDAWHHRR